MPCASASGDSGWSGTGQAWSTSNSGYSGLRGRWPGLEATIAVGVSEHLEVSVQSPMVLTVCGLDGRNRGGSVNARLDSTVGDLDMLEKYMQF